MPKRECGTCSLCCKVLDVAAMFKPAGKWCQVCAPGKGCTQYMLRPKQCRDFQCLWLMDESLTEAWKPEVAKFVLASEYEGRVLSVMVDPGQPNAWKREPYYSVLKQMTIRQMSEGRIIMIVDDTKRQIMLPDGEALLGERGETFSWQIARSETPTGPHFAVEITRGSKAA